MGGLPRHGRLEKDMSLRLRNESDDGYDRPCENLFRKEVQELS
jgi:hypothetical protein